MGKMQRDIADPKYQSLGYKVTFVTEPGYKKNVSFARIRSMNHFNAGVKKILKTHESVDVVYIPVPSIKLAAIGEKWCKKVGAKSVIDVEDLWPESFQMIIKPKFFCNALTWPLMLQANKTYQKADAVVAVSQTYMDRVKHVRKDAFPNVVAPIGADVDYVHSIISKGTAIKPAGEFWVSYIGTFGKSYDLRMCIDAVSLLYTQGHTNIILKMMGSGPEFEEIRAYASSKPGKFEFLGLIPYEQMCRVLAASDVGLNPIVKGSVASLINKVADYAACGLPVVNSQDCGEYRELLDQYQAGKNIDCGSERQMADSILSLYVDPQLRFSLAQGSRHLGYTVFSRKVGEIKIMHFLEDL